jgi:hypothetical protein
MKVDAGLIYPRRPACPDPNTPFLCGDCADQGMLHYPNCQLRVGPQCCTDSAHCCPDITCAPSGFFCCGEEGFCTKVLINAAPMRAVLHLDLSVVGVGIVVTQLITPIAVAISSL